MTSNLSSEQLARLHTKLVVPYAIGDVIRNGHEVTPDIQYALHEALSEMDPDTALLAIALSTGHIAAQLCPTIPVAGALSIEAEKIMNEYGSDWLDHADGRTPSREGYELFSVLEHIPEDLEALADILDSVCASLKENDLVLREICYILSIQARAHMEIADFVLSEIQGHDLQTEPHEFTTEDFADNIILFPHSTVH